MSAPLLTGTLQRVTPRWRPIAGETRSVQRDSAGFLVGLAKADK
jgi:hypothetical protein